MSSSMSNIEVAFVYVWDVFMMYCRRNVLSSKTYGAEYTYLLGSKQNGTSVIQKPMERVRCYRPLIWQLEKCT